MTAGDSPLRGKRILVTRPRDQAAEFVTTLESLGAEVLAIPAIRIEPLDSAPLRAALAHFDRYQWLIFTSRNAVQIVFDELRRMGGSIAASRVVAVGPKTAEALRERGVDVTVTPDRFVAEGVLEALSQRDDVPGSRFLYAAAEAARDTLPLGLRRLGAEVDVIQIYRAAVPAGSASSADLRARLERGAIDVVTFASGSAVRAFVESVGANAARLAPAVSIGPVTSEAVRAHGLTLLAEAEEHTTEGLVRAIVSALDSHHG